MVKLRVIKGGKDLSYYNVEIHIIHSSEDGVTATDRTLELLSSPDPDVCERLVNEMVGHAQALIEDGWLEREYDNNENGT